MEQAVGLGGQAASLLDISSASTTTFSWSTTNIREMAESEVITIGTAGDAGWFVHPGEKWIVMQYTGDAGYTRLRTRRMKMCDVVCGDSIRDKCGNYKIL